MREGGREGGKEGGREGGNRLYAEGWVFVAFRSQCCIVNMASIPHEVLLGLCLGWKGL